MSLFYHVVQPSFHDRQWYPFVDTETKSAYTIVTFFGKTYTNDISLNG